MSRYVELYRETPIRDEYQDAHFMMLDDTVYVNDQPMTKEQITRPGKWRWRMVSSGRIVADSGQGYVRRIDMVHALCGVIGGRLIPGNFIMRHAGTTYEQIPIHDLTRKDQE